VVRRLIVNADDFGLTPGVNRAIVEAHQHGIVTSATMMAGAPAFDAAAEQARALSSVGAPFSVGCHIVLVDGVPLSPPAQVPSLLEGEDGSARFCENLSSFATAALTGSIHSNELETEATAQIRRIQQAGLKPSHFDTHKHAHMFPAILRPLLRAAKTCGITAVRNPFGPGDGLPLTRVAANLKLASRFAQMGVLRSFAPGFRREVAANGLRTPDGCFGVQVTGILDLRLFVEIASNLPEGTWEFVCHPGYNDTDLDGVRTRLRASREQELDVLTSPESKHALEKHGVHLISYNEL
jgi:chitin disaccharide deacetylase